MAARRRSRAPPRRTRSKPRRPARAARPRARARTRRAAPGGFVGRDPSPVLDRYPPKDPGIAAPPPIAPAGRPAPPAPSPSGAPVAPAAPAAAGGTPISLIALEAPFDIEAFSSELGENLVEVTVPREQLGEVLRRTAEFMGFGIYVYEISVRPAPEEMLKGFVVTLRRVDYKPGKGGWTPFEELGRSDSPFGPEGRR